VTKFVLALAAAHALTAPSCGDTTDVGTLSSPITTLAPASDEPSEASSAAKEASEADCPTPDPGQNAGESWTAAFEEDPSTNASSVAVDASHDAYMTTLAGGTRKLAAGGAVVWTKPWGTLVATDEDGDVIVSGAFAGAITLDGTTLASAGERDVFVARLDTDGNVLDAVTLGAAGDDSVQSIAVDRAGRVVVSGPGLGTVALDADDTPAWRVDYFGYVATDAAGDVLVTGALTGSADFGGGTLTSAGGKDVFVVKLDEGGNHVFSHRYGDAGAAQEGQAISADPEGNVVIAGVFDESIDFGTGALEPARCPSEAWCAQSGFVAKLDANGNTLFGVTRGAMRALTGIANTPAGGVVVSGAGPADASPPFRMPVVFALDGSGSSLWSKMEWPETGLGSGRGVAVDGCGSVLWSVSAKPSFDTNERAYLVKLSPSSAS
jgi:hypothetical protein